MKTDILQKLNISKTQIEDYKSKAADELYADETIRAFLDSNKLDSEFVNNHLVELLQMKEKNSNCVNCQGYLQCKNEPKGYQTTLIDIDGDYETTFVECPKLAEVSKTINAYEIRDFDDEWLYNSLNCQNDNIKKTTAFKECLKIALGSKNKGIYIYGNSGVGKSYLISALINNLITADKTTAFIDFKKFIGDIKSSFDEKSNYFDEIMRTVKTVDVLAIDDLGGEKATDWTIHTVLFEIINERMHSGKLTLFTSMYSLNELKKLYGGNTDKRVERVMNCISTLADEVELTGMNYFKFK